MSRKRLLSILQKRARALGVNLQFETDVASVERYQAPTWCWPPTA